MSLREDGTQPRGELASAVKIIKQRRFPLASVAVQTIKLRVQRVRQVTRARFAGRTDDRTSRTAKHGPIANDEFLPRGIRTVAQRASERQILQMQPAKISLEYVAQRQIAAKAM